MTPFCGTDATVAYGSEPAGHPKEYLNLWLPQVKLGQYLGAAPIAPAPIVPTAPTVPTSVEEDASCYTLQDVQLHNTPNDCWQLIYDRVYDLTDYGMSKYV